MNTLAQKFIEESEKNPDMTLAEFHELHGYPGEDEDFGTQVIALMRGRVEE